MARLRELPAIGLGLTPTPAGRAASAALTWRERRKVHANIRAGVPAWDAPSARYAVEVARAQALLEKPFGRWTAVAAWVLVTFGWFNVAVQSFGSGPLEFAQMLLRILCAVAFTVFAIRYPAWRRNGHRAQALNAPLVVGDLLTLVASAPPTPREEAIGAVLAALLFGVPFGVAAGVTDSSVVGGMLAGTFFGVLMVVVFRRLIGRRLQA